MASPRLCNVVSISSRLQLSSCTTTLRAHLEMKRLTFLMFLFIRGPVWLDNNKCLHVDRLKLNGVRLNGETDMAQSNIYQQRRGNSAEFSTKPTIIS